METTNKGETITARPIEDEMKQSYLDYAMSVIVGRALPDVRDGLKPVHRRILYGMYDLGMFHNKPFKKSARIVGEILGKYHPHGDIAVYDALVRMAQDFSLRSPLIQGQGNFGCFTKDTKLALTDGRNLSFEELINEHKKGKQNFAYTMNNEGFVEISEIKKPRLTKKNQEIMKVVLDNCEEIKCTLNHRFMMRDGEYKEAMDLKPGDSLMPLHLRLSDDKDNIKPELRGYQMVYQPKINSWSPCHNLADEWNLKDGIYKKNAGRIRHHIDFDKLNNSPDNIIRIKWEEHWGYHANHASTLHKDEAYRLKIAEGRNKFWENTKNREAYSKRLSERNKKNWTNPEYRKAMREFLSKANKEYLEKHPEKKEEFSKRATQTLKRLWNNPEYRRMKSNSLRERWKDPLYINGQAERFKKISAKIWSDTEHREYISRISKERWGDKRYKEKIINSYKYKWKNDPEFRKYLLGILSENGKKSNYYKFLKICKKAIELHGELNEENYEKVRISYNSRKGAGIIKFSPALGRFFNGDIDKLYTELGINRIKLNHKVKEVIFLKEMEEVYDITIDNTHNFALASGVFVHNSIDGDSPAAMRYTEARLSKLAEEMLQDIDKETVKFVPNFDNSLKEPSVLPSKLPNLLINGSSGIAVGMATNIPPHNLGEVIGGIVDFIDNPEASFEEIMAHIKGPDFPTGGLICGINGIKNAYHTGNGRIVVRAKTSVEKIRNKEAVIVTEIPYMVNKAQMIEHIADLVRDKKITGISDIRDESDRDGMRIVIELKQDANSEVVLNQLYIHTRMQTTFGANMLALVNNEPKVLNLKQIIENYVSHRREIVRKRTIFELSQAQSRAHILEGLIIALDNIDEAIKLIKESKSTEQAREALISAFTLTKEQSNAILDMKLQRLTSLEQEKIKKEHSELIKLIEELKSILASAKKIDDIIKKELFELQKYSNERRSQIINLEATSLEMEDIVEEESTVITVTHSGYIKRMPLTAYKQQKRGGKGIIATGKKEEDFVKDIFIANTHSYILFFTNRGRVHWLKVYNIPESSRYASGKPIVNLIEMDDEKVTAFVPVKSFDDSHYLIMATKKGVIKKTNLDAYSHPRKGGIIAITLENNDELINVKLTDGKQQIVLATKSGTAVRFNETDVRPTGRSASGVRGISLRDDEVIGMVVATDDKTILTVTENGYGKRTSISEYRLTARGGVGVRNILCSERNGTVVSIGSVSENDEVMFISKNGITIRVPAKDISVIGRSTQGVRIMRLDDGDKVVGAARIAEE